MDFNWLTSDFLNGLGTVGIAVLVMLLLIFGKGLALMREVKDRDKTIEWQRLTIDELNAQNRELLTGNYVAANALDKVSNAAVQQAGEGP